MKIFASERGVYVGVLIVYSLIYFVFTDHFPWQFSQQLFGSHNGDASQFFWNVFHFGQWAQGKQEYFFTNLLYAPHGSGILFHSYSHLMTAFSYVIGDSYWGINIFIWLNYAFSGLGAFMVGRRFKLNIIWSFLCGFVFTFIPYKFSHITGHYNLQLTAFIPFFVLAFFQIFPTDLKSPILKKITLRGLIPLVLSGILCLLSCYVYSVFLFIFSIGYFLYQLIHRKIQNIFLRWCLLILLIFAASNIVPYLDDLGMNNHSALWWRDDIGKFFTPSFYSKIYPSLTPKLFDNYSRLKLKHADCFIGFVMPVLFVVSLVLILFKRKKQNTLLGFLSLFFFMLTSPEILIYMDKIGYFPTSLFHFVPVVNNARIPERFIIMFVLFLLLIYSAFFSRLSGIKKNLNLGCLFYCCCF